MDESTRLRFFSSDDQRWATPKWLYDRFNEVFRFKLDPCCSPKTAKCDMFFTKSDDGLKQNWHEIGNTYINPPFGRELYSWVEKSYQESLEGIVTCMLIPARPDTKSWHRFIFPHSTILFLKGRVVFEDQREEVEPHKNPAFFPSAFVMFGDISEYPIHKLEDLGHIVKKI